MDFQNLKNQYEEQIRSGQILSVRNQIESLPIALVPRGLAADFADIARRVRCEIWGLRLLYPYVRCENVITPAATDVELCTYAGLLIKIGAFSEAQTILLSLNENKNVNVLFFLGQLSILQWNYADAVNHFKKVQTVPGISFYQKCMAQVNLAAAHLNLSQHDLVEPLLLQILKDSKENKWEQLHGNALELGAQLSVIQRDWAQAEFYLTQAESIAKAGQQSSYLNFIEKWKTLSALFQAEPGSAEAAEVFKKIAGLAQKSRSLQYWESLRDYDYYIALFLNSQSLLLNIYFGTPFAAYKKRIEKLFLQNGWAVPKQHTFELAAETSTRILDLQLGEEIENQLVAPLRPEQMLHRLINILAMDLYKPIGIGELFTKLYPDENFNPDSSPNLIAEEVQTLCDWFNRNKIPLNVVSENQRLSLKASGPYAFKISKKSQTPEQVLASKYALQLIQVKEKWPYQTFSSERVADVLKISINSAQSFLKKAADDQHIQKTGEGRSVLYRFPK